MSTSDTGQDLAPGSAAASTVRLPLRRTIASGTLWSGIGRLGVLGFGLLAQALIARLLAPEAFGSYTLILSAAGLIALICQLGLPQSTVRHIARAAAAPEGSQARSALSTSITFTLLAAAVGSVLALWPVGGLVDLVFPTVRVEPVLGLFAALVGVRILDNIAPELFRGLRDFRNGSIFGGFLNQALLAAVTGAVLLLTGTAPLQVALAITIATSAAGLVTAAVLLWRRLRSLPEARKAPLLDPEVVSPAIWVAAVISFAIIQLDLWVVGALGDGREVALYSAAFRLAFLVTAPLTIVNFVVPPLVVELLAKGERDRLRLVVQTVATVAGAPALVMLVVFGAFGAVTCALVYGDFYAVAGTPLALLAVGKLAGVLAGPCGLTLIMSGGQRANLVILAINMAVTLPLQVVGFQVAGLAGLAAATSIGFALQQAHLVIAVRRRIGVGTEFNLPQTWRLARDLAGRGALRDLLIPNGRHDPEAGK